MKKPRMNVIAVTIVFFIFNLIRCSFCQDQISTDLNCFSIIVGRNASADGSVLLAHNEDDYGKHIVNYYKVPRLKHQSDETITLSTGAVIPQAPETYSYFWFEMPGMYFSDSYANEWGVVIASDACSSREDQPELADGGIKYWLRRLIAERARTAREGVKIAGKLISELGYASSGRTYLIVAPNEGWMLAAVHGKHWVAQRVPDDRVAVIPNYYTIGEINLSDTSNFLGSPDLIDYAIQQGWFDPGRDGKFHFARVYSSPGNLTNSGNVHRMWRGINLLADKNYAMDAEFPFAIKPKKKVSVQDLMAVLRDHYEGTELDKTANYQLGNPFEMNGSTICANSTQYGFVAQLRNWLPADVGCIIWQAQYRPDSQAFIPWYFGINKMPDGYAYGDFQTALEQHFNPPENIHEMTTVHAFWAFVRLADQVDRDYGKRIVPVRQKWSAMERTIFKKQNGFEKKVLKIYRKNPTKARIKLTDYTNEWAGKAWRIANELQSKMDNQK